MRSWITASSFMLLVTAGPTLAQGPPGPAPGRDLAPAQPGSAVETRSGQSLLASRILKATLKTPAGDTVGDISDLVLDASGKVVFVVVGVGGFLGLGEKSVAIDYNLLRIGMDNDNRVAFTAAVTKDGLRSLDPWRGLGGATPPRPPASTPKPAEGGTDGLR